MQAAASKPDCDAEFAAKVDAAALRLRLNTELRRRIFRTIIAAQDIQHAFEALVRLQLGSLSTRTAIQYSLCTILVQYFC